MKVHNKKLYKGEKDSLIGKPKNSAGTNHRLCWEEILTDGDLMPQEIQCAK